MNGRMRNRVVVSVLAFLTVLLWGSGFPFTRAIGDEISPSALVFIRCFVAALVLLIIGKICHIRKPLCRKDLMWFFLSGMMGFSVYFMFYNMGMETLTSATGCVITAACPVLTSIGVWKIYDEKINAIGWISIAAAFVGVLILILWNGLFSVNIGAVWMLGVAVVFAGYCILSRKFSEMGYTGLEIATWSAVFAAVQTLFLLPEAVTEVLNASFEANLAALYLAAFAAGVAYFLWSKAIELAERTSEVTNYMFINPLIAAIIGFLLLGEVPDMGTYIGGAVIIISVIVFSLKGSPKEKTDMENKEKEAS